MSGYRSVPRLATVDVVTTPPVPTPAAAVVEECVDCAKRPPKPTRAQLAELVERDTDPDPYVGPYRPAKLRPIDPRSRKGQYGGPRSLRCASDYVAHRNARKQAESDSRSRKRSGTDEDTRQEVLDEQGRVCAGCKRPGVGGSGKGKRRNLAADHDHDLAAEHDHCDDVACLDCLRGYLCTTCNRRILGTLRGLLRSDAAVMACLTNLAAYLADPPAARVRRRRAADELVRTGQELDEPDVDLLANLAASLDVPVTRKDTAA